MRRTKRWSWGVLALGAGLVFGPRPAYCQAAPAVPPMLAMIAQALGLTADQQARIVTLRLTAAAQIQAVLSNPQLSPEQRFLLAQQIRAGARAQILALLTPAQQQQLAALRASRSR